MTLIFKFKSKILSRSITGLIIFVLSMALIISIQLLLPLNYTQKIVILTYHRVSNSLPNSWDGGETITPQQFRAHMTFLKEHRFHVMSLDDALIALQSPNQTIPAKSIVLTFDDGDQSYAQNAVPILRNFQFPSTEFIIGKTSLYAYAKKESLSWPEIKLLAQNPLITFHSHTFNAHYTLNSEGKTYFATDPLYLPQKHRLESTAEYRNRISHDFKEEQDLFQKYLGRKDNMIALPYGHADPSFISLAQKSGYPYILTQDRTRANFRGVNPAHLFRLDVGNMITDTKRLSLLLKGLTSSGPLHGIFWLKVKYSQILFNLSPKF